MTFKWILRRPSNAILPAGRRVRARRGGAFAVEALEKRLLLSGTWTQIPSIGEPLGTMLLLPDGSVMAQDSGNAPGSNWERLKPASTGSYVNGTSSSIAPMRNTRLFDASQVLPSGNVFVAGGEYGTGGSTGEMYEPLINTWVALPPQNYGQILDANSILLPDGKVLIAPVEPAAPGGTVLFDPSADAWSAGPSLLAGRSADERSWVKLADGSVLMADGPDSSERLIPALNEWVPDGAVPVDLFDANREQGAAFLLPDGQAFFIGATGHTALYTPSGTIAPGTWSAGPDLPNALGADDAPAAMMPDGNILMALGPSGTYDGPTSFYLYNSASNSFSQVSGITDTAPPYQGRMLDLPDGNVLFTNGTGGVWEYSPGDAPLPEAKPTITSIALNSDGTYTLTGTNFNGISQGASYGDDAQMDTNFPLVRMTDLLGNVTYARTFNWSSTGVMTGNAIESTEFATQVGITGAVQVVVNGVASDPIYPNGHPIAPTVAIPAASLPGTFTGITIDLSVLGNDPSGSESDLTYIWQGTGPSDVPPTFSPNATNSAKNTTAAFSHAGTYSLLVTIGSPGGLWINSSVSVTVAQTESGLKIGPSNTLDLSSSMTQRLGAYGVDQFGNVMNLQTPVTWRIISGGGTIAPNGVYTAPPTGTRTILSATDGQFSATSVVGVVPQPWTAFDVGGPRIAGLSYANGGTFIISGSGDNVAVDDDQFQFVFVPVSGYFAITARITSEQNTGDFAYAGLMIRDSLYPSEVFAAVNLTPAGRTDFSYRTAQYTHGTYAEIDGSPAPYWLRLVRTDDTVRAYRSPDGVSWTLEGTVNLPLNNVIYVGMDVCSHTNERLNTSTFDNVSLNGAAVIGRYVFYNNSAYDGNDPAPDAADDNAIATDKTALAAGNAAGPANFTSYSKGINGIMIDVQNLPGTPTAADFSFRMGDSATPATWTAAPAPSDVIVRAGAGVDGSDRIEITWPDGAIRNQWLQVTVASDAATGLNAPDVFYFGNLVGSALATTANGSFTVTSADMDSVLSDTHTFPSLADITDPNDFNRDGRIDALDELIARFDSGAALLDLTPPPTPASPIPIISRLAMRRVRGI